jgi:hypothetical protein
MGGKIQVENVGQPGKTYVVDATKYAEMHAKFLAILPSEAPGLTVAQINDAVRPTLDQTLFPGGDTCGWWVKTVQLDLEAKGVIKRGPKSPVRLWKIT